VLATQIRQKDGIFYFGSIRAPELLAKVRFISRFYGEGEEIAPARISQEDEIAQFISKIERTDRAFQRALSQAKVRQLKNFYETAITQPPIPGTVLLFTPEKLRFQAADGTNGVGQLSEPQSKFLIIDGQHRLAALRFYLEERPDDAKTINVPCVIFDGRHRDVRHHQLDAHPHQQKPPRRPVRAGFLGGAPPQIRRAPGRKPL